MKPKILIIIYLIAIVIANLTVTVFGPSISIVSALLLIGLDLTARDHLHEFWDGRFLWPKMLALITAGSLLSFVLNRSSGSIALASFIAFAGAGISDTIIYWLLADRAALIKINGSNIISAGVDSFLFPVLAFGYPILWSIVFGQFVAKTLGGFLWSILLNRFASGGYNER